MKTICTDTSTNTLLVTLENIPSLETSLVRAYKSVFNASVWREGAKCGNGCGYKSTFEEASKNCPTCGGGIVDYYSDGEVISTIQEVLLRKETSRMMCVLNNSQQVTAFVWGWIDAICSINEEKLQLSQKELSEFYRQSGIKNIREKFFYTSEMGVVPDKRGKSIAKQLFGVIELERKTQFQVEGILRTSQSSPMFFISQKAGYDEVWMYNDTDQRTLLISNS